jgi:hypothetical protein
MARHDQVAARRVTRKSGCSRHRPDMVAACNSAAEVLTGAAEPVKPGSVGAAGIAAEGGARMTGTPRAGQGGWTRQALSSLLRGSPRCHRSLPLMRGGGPIVDDEAHRQQGADPRQQSSRPLIPAMRPQPRVTEPIGRKRGECPVEPGRTTRLRWSGREPPIYEPPASAQGCCACIQSAAACALLAAVKIARGSCLRTRSHEAI